MSLDSNLQIPKPPHLTPLDIDYGTDDKKVWGPRWWFVFHQMARNYPEKPDRSDRITFNTTFKNMLRYLPCPDECRKNAMEWVRKNPPDLDSRESLSKYMCRFHNDGREEQIDCETIMGSSNSSPSCSSGSCSSSTTVTDTTSGGHDRISRAIIASKEKKKELFYALCDQYKIKRPDEFVHEPCPTHPETSCIDYHDLNKIRPYLNPYTDSDKQVIHEFEHYRALVMSGKISDEDTAEKFAYEKISRAYPINPDSALAREIDKPFSGKEGEIEKKPFSEEPGVEKSEVGLNPPPQSQASEKPSIQPEPPMPPPPEPQQMPAAAAAGTDTTRGDVADVNLIKKSQPKPRKSRDKIMGYDFTIPDVVSNSSVALGDLDTSLEGNSAEGFEERFPNYARLKRESEARQAEEQISKKMNDGFITYLDPVYRFPAKVLGIKEGQMNLAHTPEIVHNLVMALVQANTTAVGSGLFAFITGLSLFVVGYFAKASITYKDQLALQNISAAFLWRTLQYLNPKEEMKKQLKDMFHRVQEGDLRLSDTLIETPGMWKKKKHKRENAWMNMPHRLGKDERGRPAFIIPAPYAMAAMASSPGAPLGGPIGDSDKSSVTSIHGSGPAGVGSGYYGSYGPGGYLVPGAGSPMEARNIMGQPLGDVQDPATQLVGEGFYDIGTDPGDEYVMQSLGYGINPDVYKSVNVYGAG